MEQLDSILRSKTKDADETAAGIKRFLGPQKKAEHVYTDGSKEFKKACEDLQVLHDPSTPYVPETNGIIERVNRRVIEGTSSILSQSGLSVEWWEEAQECFNLLWNATEICKFGKTPYERRFQRKFDGPLWPFGCEVSYLPSADKDKDKTHKFGEKKLQGIF